ncbi:hypothetical protein [Streptomyces sp. F63]|nr:hypothetical protein [Streptomyces sp. F63]
MSVPANEALARGSPEARSGNARRHVRIISRKTSGQCGSVVLYHR